MKLREVLVDVWSQTLVQDHDRVNVDGREYRVRRTRTSGLKIVSFEFEGRTLDGIEQNPQTSSRWAKLAQEGQRIMQFKSANRYFANVCEAAVTRYPSWASLGLPE